MTLRGVLAAGTVFSLAVGGVPLGTNAARADQLRIGLMNVLTGPQAALGKQINDGFNLGVKHAGGKLGGVDTQIIVQDDELKPDVAVNKAKQLLERDKVQIVVGPTFSNVLMAISKPITDAKTILISPNPGPSPLAGKGCNAWFLSTSYQNELPPSVLGEYTQKKGIKKVFILAPNYQAGKDMVGGFKRYFKGEIADEIYTPLGHLDFSAELAKVAAAKPDAMFVFMPGGMGVNLVKQYKQAGLDKIPFYSVFTVDESTLPAQQDAAVGMYSGMTWAPNLDNPENKKFVADFEAAYGYVPGSYAMHAYDAARLIDASVKAIGGKVDDRDALLAQLKKADFKSVRGAFKFNKNGFPVQDYYLVRVAKRADGKFETQIDSKVFTALSDPFVAQCELK